MNKEVFIEVKGLTSVYGKGTRNERQALTGISMSIYRGEFLAIIGPNGSGKSTLARHFNALLLPGEGQVMVDGLNTLREEYRWEIRRQVGMVFQNPDNQIVSALVEEDVAFGPENLGLPPAEVRERVEEALSLAGLAEHRHRPPHLLSGGLKIRLAVAGVLAMRPSCIILDEPTSMLDPRGRRSLMETLTRLNRENEITVILVTHFMEEAVRADRVLVLNGGKVALLGTPREIFTRAEEVLGHGLDLPATARVARGLKKRGLPVPDGILTVTDMVNFLCR